MSCHVMSAHTLTPTYALNKLTIFFLCMCGLNLKLEALMSPKNLQSQGPYTRSPVLKKLVYSTCTTTLGQW